MCQPLRVQENEDEFATLVNSHSAVLCYRVAEDPSPRMPLQNCSLPPVIIVLL